MKKILFSMVLLSQIVFSAENQPKDYTVEEMLNKLYSNEKNIENLENNEDFKYMYKYMSDFSEKDKEMLSKLYLYFLHQTKQRQEKFNNITEEMLTSMDVIQHIETQGKFITINDKNNNPVKIIDNILYFIDFENEKLYSSNLGDFVNNKFNNLYSLKYEVTYNRLLIVEPKNNKTNYASIINLAEDVKFSFKDLKETIETFMQKTKSGEL